MTQRHGLSPLITPGGSGPITFLDSPKDPLPKAKPDFSNDFVKRRHLKEILKNRIQARSHQNDYSGRQGIKKAKTELEELNRSLNPKDRGRLAAADKIYDCLCAIKGENQKAKDKWNANLEKEISAFLTTYTDTGIRRSGDIVTDARAIISYTDQNS